MLQEGDPRLRDLLKFGEAPGRVEVQDVQAAGRTGTESSVTTADTHNFPLTREQVVALLKELQFDWIKDKDVVVPLLRDMRVWAEKFEG
jgi:hypothetical protein